MYHVDDEDSKGEDAKGTNNIENHSTTLSDLDQLSRAAALCGPCSKTVCSYYKTALYMYHVVILRNSLHIGDSQSVQQLSFNLFNITDELS